MFVSVNFCTRCGYKTLVDHNCVVCELRKALKDAERRLRYIQQNLSDNVAIRFALKASDSELEQAMRIAEEEKQEEAFNNGQFGVGA